MQQKRFANFRITLFAEAIKVQLFSTKNLTKFVFLIVIVAEFGVLPFSEKLSGAKMSIQHQQRHLGLRLYDKRTTAATSEAKRQNHHFIGYPNNTKVYKIEKNLCKSNSSDTRDFAFSVFIAEANSKRI